MKTEGFLTLKKDKLVVFLLFQEKIKYHRHLFFITLVRLMIFNFSYWFADMRITNNKNG